MGRPDALLVDQDRTRRPTGNQWWLLPRRGATPAGELPVIAYVCTVDVSALDDYLKKAQARGGVVAVPKMAIPGIGWLAYCKDTEGNIFGMMQTDPKAA